MKGLLTFIPDRPEVTLPLFALGKGRGEVHVDNLTTTRNVAIVLDGVGPGDVSKVFLYGNSRSDEMREFLTDLDEPVEVFCDVELGDVVTELYPEDVSFRTRTVFTFDRLSDEYRFSPVEGLRRLGATDLAAVKDLLPARSWAGFDSAKDMLMGGAVFGMVENDELISVAFVTDFTSKYDTLSAFTAEPHRRGGNARLCSQKLMAWTMDRGRFPRIEVGERNPAGLALAKGLGFPVTLRVTSYFLDIF